VVHEVGQAALVPTQRYGAQLGLPAPAISVQVPSAVEPSAFVQASQAPVQAVPQQTPSAQKPDVHWSFAVHAPARVLFATQAPLELQ
jgi:hypothetical protein